MANLVLAFGEVLVGAILMDAAVKGDTIPNVIKGTATQQALPGSSSSTSTSTAGAGAAGAGAGSSTLPAGSYTRPVPVATSGRVDQGVDYTLGSAGFVAPGRSKIVYTGAGSGWGNEYVAGQLLDGPLAGSVWYVAEAASKLAGIAQGAIVNAGQQITPAGSSTGGAIEAGWADPSNPGNPLAQSLSGYSGDQSRAGLTAGYSFSMFAHALGAPAGVFEGAGQALGAAIESEFESGGAIAGIPFG